MGELVKDAAVRLARETLDAHWDGSLPVDPAKIAMRHGIAVFRSDLRPDVSGLIMKTEGNDPQIHLQRTDSPQRQNFTCAHELGHFIERSSKPSGPDREYSFVDLRQANNHDLHELFANEFAGALLMPEAEFRKQWAKNPIPSILAHRFAVSLPAVHMRLQRLGIR